MDKFVLQKTRVGQCHCQGRGGRVVWRRKGPPQRRGLLHTWDWWRNSVSH